MPSPTCLVNGLATTNGVDVTKNTTVTIQLADTAGVITWEIECIGTDDLHTTAGIGSTLVITDITNKTATFHMPDDFGVSCIFQSRVNNGVDLNNRVQLSYTTTFKVATLINSNRTIAVNETMESNATFGWAKPVNQIIRASLSSEIDFQGDVSGSFSAAVVDAIKGTEVGTAGGALTDGYFLGVTGSATCDWKPVTMLGDVLGTNLTNTCSLAGDVEGRTGANTVNKIKGTTITTAGGALTPGSVLRATTVNAADWGQVDLADADAVTGILPRANHPSAIFAATTVNTYSFSSGGAKIDIISSPQNYSNGLTVSTSSDNITVVTAGYYRLYAGVNWENATSTAAIAGLTFHVNNSPVSGQLIASYDQVWPNGSWGNGKAFSFIEMVVSLNVNDVVDLQGTSDTNLTINGGIFGMNLL